MKLIEYYFNYAGIDYTAFGYDEMPYIKKVKQLKTFYEIGLLEYIRSLNLEGIYIDGGCAFGNHTTYFANHCKSTKVYSIDADLFFKKFFDLHCNANIKNTEKIKYIFSAIMDTTGFVSLNPPHTVPQISCVDIKNLEVTKEGEIPATTLDVLFKDIEEKIAFIKLDIEGSELKALQGAEQIIKRDLPVIAAEAWTKQQQSDIKKYLEGFGYKVTKVFTDAPMFVFRSTK